MKKQKRLITHTLDRVVEHIDKHITKEHLRIINHTQAEARNYAQRNLPDLSDTSLDGFLSSTTAAYDALQADVKIQLEAGIQQKLGAANMATLAQKLADNQSAGKQEEEHQRHLIIDKERIRTAGANSEWQKKKLYLFILIMCECAWMVGCFIQVGDIVLIGLVTGIAVGLAQGFGTKGAVQTIREIENKEKQRRYIIIALSALCIFSLAIGALRYFFVHLDTAPHIPFFALNPLTFAAINMILVIACALIIWHYLPSKAKMIQLHQLEKIEKESAQSNKRQQQLQVQRSELLSEREAVVEIRTKLAHYEEKMLEKIAAYSRQAIGAFINENTLRRSDGMFPPVFKTPFQLSTPQSNDYVSYK